MAIGLLTAGTTANDEDGSFGQDVADTVNAITNKIGTDDEIIKAEAIHLAGLPQTAGAPEGFGDLATVLNAAPFPRFSPIAQATSNDVGGIAFNVASGSPVITYENAPNCQPALKIVFSAFCQIEFPALVNAPYDGHMYVQVYGSQTLTNLSTCRLRAFVSGSEANYRQGERTAIANGLNSPYDVGDTPITWHFSPANTTSVGSPPAAFVGSRYQLNLNPQAATTATLYIFAVGVGQPRKSRICVVYDDGYD